MKRFSRESGFDNPRVLRYFAKYRKITDGSVSFVSDEYHFWLPVLESAIRVREDVGQKLKHQCISQVVWDATCLRVRSIPRCPGASRRRTPAWVLISNFN
jgi:hypothetical protein